MLNKAEVLSRLRTGGWKLYRGSNPVHGVYLYMQCLADGRCVDVKRPSAKTLVTQGLVVHTADNEWQFPLPPCHPTS